MSAFNFVLTIVTQNLLLKTSIYFHVVSGSELLEMLRFLHILIVQTRTPVSCEFLDSVFLHINSNELDFFSQSPPWPHFWLGWFETQNNQNQDSQRKSKVLKTENTHRLRDERESFGLIYHMVHDKSFLFQDQRNLHLASQKRYTRV